MVFLQFRCSELEKISVIHPKLCGERNAMIRASCLCIPLATSSPVVPCLFTPTSHTHCYGETLQWRFVAFRGIIVFIQGLAASLDVKACSCLGSQFGSLFLLLLYGGSDTTRSGRSRNRSISTGT